MHIPRAKAGPALAHTVACSCLSHRRGYKSGDWYLQKLRKLTFLRASIHHSPQVETTLTFLDREKGWAEAEALSSEDDVTGFGVWGTPHHKVRD